MGPSPLTIFFISSFLGSLRKILLHKEIMRTGPCSSHLILDGNSSESSPRKCRREFQPPPWQNFIPETLVTRPSFTRNLVIEYSTLLRKFSTDYRFIIFCCKIFLLSLILIVKKPVGTSVESFLLQEFNFQC